jgi:hypothetical protein
MTRWAFVVVVAAFATRAIAAPGGDERCRLGVLRAQEGRLASAESLFVAVLSDSRHDARALNNLGNIELLNNRPGVALSYFTRAQAFDSLDAGIRLNRALAYAAMGDTSSSRREASAAGRLAGSPDSVAALLGLRPGEPWEEEPERGAGQSSAARARAWVILRASIGPLPPRDSTKAAPPRGSGNPTQPAGPRAGNAADNSAYVYWKF